ncbi:hypothetical protein FEM48_Zijuj12G0108700 [Ziziphus jujuba var. spinosa]|uniref:Glycosyltransferase n=1 Tax=Ziziphus jujuba var. spinosa TaxID=714518 RepID=A0A978UCW5_ZIZJJ|nr:hypothetical protein FEM48_Zijuj12G0108700 [Ziziphus jujuba var. spinosa]
MANFHIAMYPWFALGHMTAFLHLANELAARGHRISFLLPKKPQFHLHHQNLHPQLITFPTVTVPTVDGLPPGAETTSEIPLSSNSLLAAAMDLSRDQVESFLRSTKPDLVMYDFAHWIPNTTKRLGIKSVCYCTASASAISIALVPAKKVPKNRPMTEEELNEIPDGYPSSTIVLRGHEVLSLMFVSLPFGDGITFYERATTAMKNCDAMCIRTCRELESKFCDYIGNQYEKPVLLTGPVLSKSAKTSLEERWDKWLGGFEPSSVVYCAFGSQIVLEKDQFEELVLGFEQTGLPFLVALKPPNGCTTIEEALPEGFEERLKGRGVVYGGWVQQTMILSHESVGCFVSHCGFGSMWESLMSDKQIVAVPQLDDQILNARLLVEELKVALEVKREENGWFWKESLSGAIKSVMDKDSEVGIMVKKNHAKWKEVLTKPGFMSGYIDKFVDDLNKLVNQN